MAALQKRIHHLSHDRPGTNDGNLHHDVIEALGTQARQARHLGPAFHLKHADGVGFLQRGVNRGVVRRQVSEVHFFAIMIADERDGLFQHRHHAQAEQIHFDDAEVGAIFLVPLHHHAARHGRGFERDHGIELSLADDHAAGMLSQMARQILHRFAQLKIFAQTRMAQVQPGVVEAMVERVMSIAIFPGGDGGRNFVQCFRIEAQGLAHFAPRHAVAIGDDIGSHGGAAFAVTLVQILNDALALVAAGQIEINVGPLAAFFRQETFEKQFHADGIDGGDPQRIANGAVGSGAASLDQNVLLAAEADQVPYDEKISGQLEFFDQRQLALNLTLGTAFEVGSPRP